MIHITPTGLWIHAQVLVVDIFVVLFWVTGKSFSCEIGDVNNNNGDYSGFVLTVVAAFISIIVAVLVVAVVVAQILTCELTKLRYH